MGKAFFTDCPGRFPVLRRFCFPYIALPEGGPAAGIFLRFGGNGGKGDEGTCRLFNLANLKNKMENRTIQNIANIRNNLMK
jgi:hypothetical protein